MKNYPVRGVCECGSDLHRSVKAVLHANSGRHGFLFCKKWRYHTGSGEGLQIFWQNCLHLGLLALKMKGETSQMICIFTNTAVRISPPPTVVPKRSHETTNPCVKSQTSANLIHTAFVVWNHTTVKVLRFLLTAGCSVVLFTCMPVIFRYTKTIPQQVKGKTKWAEIHHSLRLFVMWWTEIELQCMPSEHSNSDEV
jgi:hypothetical protein